MEKEELIRLIKRDLKLDKLYSALTAVLFVFAYLAWILTKNNFAGVVMGLVAIIFLIWFNSMLITKRNLQMMEVEK